MNVLNWKSWCWLVVFVAGCGTTKSQIATEQMLVSGAVDDAISAIDFRDLRGTRVFFDTQYMKDVKGVGFANADYVTSGLRQQMVAAGCLLMDKKEEADIVVEARIGAVGTDGHDIIYGIPANNSLSNAASLVPNTPFLPAIPEISLARKNAQQGAAKVAVFAYHRESRLPVWQSGISLARSSSQDVWLLGAGPFQRGTIHDKTRFAGEQLTIPGVYGASDPDLGLAVNYNKPHLFDLRTVQRRQMFRNATQPSEDSTVPERLLSDSSGGEGDGEEPWLGYDWPSLQPRLASPIESRLKWR
jgi:hypothetical protein